MPQQKKVSRAGPPTVARMVEDIVGCKWSLAVLGAIRRGIARPGALERAVTGISTKVLNERLRKLQRFGLVERRASAELSPRVASRLTPVGRRFGRRLDAVADLQAELQAERGGDAR